MNSADRLSDGSTWISVKSAMEQKLRGWTRDEGFVEFRDNVLGVQKAKLTREFLASEIREYYKEHRRKPTSLSVHRLSDGTSWSSVVSAMKLKHRGCDCEVGFIEFRDQVLGDSRKRELTKEFVESEIRKYFEAHGNPPLSHSKEKLSDGSLWRNVATAINENWLGWSSEAGFMEFRDNVLGIAKANLTREYLTGEICGYFERNGRPPSVSSKERSSDGTSWSGIVSAIYRKGRGWTEDISFVEFRDEVLKAYKSNKKT